MTNMQFMPSHVKVGQPSYTCFHVTQEGACHVKLGNCAPLKKLMDAHLERVCGEDILKLQINVDETS